jgi:adenylate kinase
LRIAFVGPPGAGKSTQAKRVARSLPSHNRSPRFSSGELVRAEIEAGTELGRDVEASYARGERVPDETILALLLPRLRRAGGFMLDNFPATVGQARALDRDLEENGAGGLTRVVCLEGLTDEELVERSLGGRRTSRATGEVYHLEHDPPPRPEERLDPGDFLERDDDTEEATLAHLEAWRREADALKGYYADRGLLEVVDARRPMAEVTEAILEALGHPERPGYYATREEVGPGKG